MSCLLVNVSISTAVVNQKIAEKVKSLCQLNENYLYERLKQGQQRGDIAEEVSARSMSRYTSGVAHGAAVLARGQQSPVAVKDLLKSAWAGMQHIFAK